MKQGLLGDIKNTRLIVAKGVLFFLLGLFALVGNLLVDSARDRLLLALIAIWAFCRFYYFLFYVLEKYVDSRFKYSGIMSLLRAVLAKQHEDR